MTAVAVASLRDRALAAYQAEVDRQANAERARAQADSVARVDALWRWLDALGVRLDRESMPAAVERDAYGWHAVAPRLEVEGVTFYLRRFHSEARTHDELCVLVPCARCGRAVPVPVHNLAGVGAALTADHAHPWHCERGDAGDGAEGES